MTTNYLRSDLERDEGVRLTSYQDTKGIWTIGVGHTGPEVVEGLVWTQDQVDNQLAKDISSKIRELDQDLSWWRGLDDIRQDVIANMAFNLGVQGLLTFHTFLRLVKEGDYISAGDDEEYHTLWAKQVGQRAVRLAEQMRTGVRQGVSNA